MSSPSEPFECEWRASRLLLAAYLATLLLALAAVAISVKMPVSLRALIATAAIGHAFWAIPRQILLSHPTAWKRLRHDQHGWHLWSSDAGWQPVQLCKDSMAWPLAIILRVRLPGRLGVRSLCVPHDALPQAIHRRLRIRLKFSRQRWKAPG